MRARLIRLGFALALVAGLSCASPPEDPLEAMPAGTTVLGDTGVARDLLHLLAAFPKSRAARWASDTAAVLDSCDAEFAAHGTDLSALGSGVACSDVDDTLAPLVSWRGDHALAMSHTSESLGRISARLDRLADGFQLEGTVPAELPKGIASLLAPASEPAGTGVLATDGTLLHARLRARGGIDLVSLIPQGAQLDRMMKLRSRLFEGAVLDGTWEVAIYTPEQGQMMMPLALALGIQHKGAAVEAVGTFIDELVAEWPIHDTVHVEAGHEGACLMDLNVLPELAPCYVATDDALVLGWNPQSLSLALAPGSEVWSRPRDGAVLHADRLAVADSHLVSRMRYDDTVVEPTEEAPAGPPLVYPADEIELELWRDEQATRFLLTIVGTP